MKLVINKPSKIDFSLVIAGTQTKPSEVRVVLGDSAKLSFCASSDDGINFTAHVTPVREFVSSICNFAIEVLFGDKIFVPIRRQITIEDDQVVIQVVDNRDSSIEQAMPMAELPISTAVELPSEPVEEVPPVELPVPNTEENKPVEIKSIDEKKFSLTKALAEAVIKSPIEEVIIPKAKAMSKLASKAATKKTERPKLFETSSIIGVETDKAKVAKSIFIDTPMNIVEEKKEKPMKKKVIENVNAAVSFKKAEIIYL